MVKKINQVISAIKRIPGATKLPSSELQNLHPPHMQSKNTFNVGDISGKKVWDGGNDGYVANGNAIEKIKPIFNEDKILRDIVVNDSEEVWGSSNVYGFEAIAWYKSFHVSNFWGVYISYSGLLRYAKKFYNLVRDESYALELAWDGIMSHESVHYGIDVACSRLEIITGTPIYLPGKLQANSNYGYSVDEERLAEGALLRYFKSKKYNPYVVQNESSETIYDIALRNSMRLPKGYSEGFQASTMPKFKFFADKYVSDLISYSLSNPNPKIFEHLELASLMPLQNKRGSYSPGFIDWSECPIYLVDDHAYTGLPGGTISFLNCISIIQESKNFIKKIKPNHIENWQITKQKLSNPIVNKNSTTLDLKRWPREDDKSNKTKAWSVRVGGKSANMRAHIDEYQETGRWVADRFGNADEMGHHKNR